MKGQAGGLIQAIHFVVVRGMRLQVLIALLDDYMAGGAGAASSAGVFDVYAEVDGDI